MSQIKEYVQLLMFRHKNHKHQTDGFTWDFMNAKDEDVRATTSVFEDTINGLSDVIMKIIVPRQRAELRNQITYLIGLRHRQAEAWERFTADCQIRENNTNQWVAQNEQ